jgi:integrase
MKAWVYQDDKQVKKKGVELASWYVGWIDPEGKKRCKSCGPGSAGKMAAQKVRKKTEAELITGTYKSPAKKTWEEFRKEFETRIVAAMAPGTRYVIADALNHFERIINPKRMAAIKTQAVDTYRTKRRAEAGRREGDTVSSATINKELRHLKAAFKKAHKWGYLPALPDVEFEREGKKLPRYVPPEHFAKLYEACDNARLPEALPYPAADWWRGLLIMAYMTGWRIGELLALRRLDVDLDGAKAVTRADDNKGKRDEQIALHPIVVEHLAKLPAFPPDMFPWPHDSRTLYVEFARLQEDAGIHLPCSRNHTHSRHCHLYGFHDLRRAFATMNAEKLTPDALQHLMRHKSYQTTQLYINMAKQMNPAIEALYVPDVGKRGKA